MYRDAQRRRLLTSILGAAFLAGCQPEGAGSITVDRKDPAIRNLKTFEDVKKSKPARSSKKPTGTNSYPRTGLP
jgi:hypothetical protein